MSYHLVTGSGCATAGSTGKEPVDTAGGVVAILESLRALQDEPLRNNLYVLITDAEELGLLDQAIGATKQTEPSQAQELLRALTEENSPATYNPLKKIIKDTTAMIVTKVRIIGSTLLGSY